METSHLNSQGLSERLPWGEGMGTGVGVGMGLGVGVGTGVGAAAGTTLKGPGTKAPVGPADGK